MNTPQNSPLRIAKVRERMTALGIDALFLSNEEEGSGINIRYLSGFTGTASVCVLTGKDQILRTDFRYELQAHQEAKGWDIRIEKGYKLDELIALIAEGEPQRLGVIAEEISLERADELKEGFSEKGLKIELVPIPNIVREVRAVKDDSEIQLVRRAVRTMEEVLREIWEMIEPGRTTDCELARVLKIMLIQRDSEISFRPIIVSGADSAFIHGDPFKLRKERKRGDISPADKVIKFGDIIQFDVGCIVDGYASDISRVAVVGKAGEEQKKMHSALCEAIDAAKELYRPGICGNKAQEKANMVLEAHGFGKLVHGLGHGIGLQVHEFPRTTEEYEFQEGNIISLEPGIYRKGFGGMRIERDVLITKDDPEFLDTLTTELVEI